MKAMAETENPIHELERRLKALEDEMAIYRLIATYGPAVDSGQSDVVAKLWTDDGEYVVEGYGVWRGHTEIAGMVEGATHQSIIMQGAAHVMGLPHVVLSGDTAIATTYS